MRFGPVLGARFSCSRHSFSISRICSTMSCFRARSRCSSASVLGGIGSPSGVRKCSRRSGAFLSLGLKLRMPSRARVALTRLTMVVCWPTRVSLAVRALGILLRDGRDRAHLAVVRLTAEPAEEGAFELLGVQPVGLGAPVLPDAGNEPALLAELDHDSLVRIEWCKGSGQVVERLLLLRLAH